MSALPTSPKGRGQGKPEYSSRQLHFIFIHQRVTVGSLFLCLLEAQLGNARGNIGVYELFFKCLLSFICFTCSRISGNLAIKFHFDWAF